MGIAFLLSKGDCNRLTLDWSQSPHKHTVALRAVLIEKYASRTVNKTLHAGSSSRD